MAGCVRPWTNPISYWKPSSSGQHWRMGKEWNAIPLGRRTNEMPLHCAAAGENVLQHPLVAQPRLPLSSLTVTGVILIPLPQILSKTVWAQSMLKTPPPFVSQLIYISVEHNVCPWCFSPTALMVALDWIKVLHLWPFWDSFRHNNIH